ncbi:hypothetical protein DL96DRAFT_1645443 [Flagelloscypha sp. PMI_526]|nr:hypothetical protein DL96DRAFT_1645443 [Flagelloscypha sp. PMI_526]
MYFLLLITLFSSWSLTPRRRVSEDKSFLFPHLFQLSLNYHLKKSAQSQNHFSTQSTGEKTSLTPTISCSSKPRIVGSRQSTQAFRLTYSLILQATKMYSSVHFFAKLSDPAKKIPNVLEDITQHQAVYNKDMYIPPSVNFTACALHHNDMRIVHWLDSQVDDYATSAQIICHLSSLTGSSAGEMCRTLYDCNEAGDDFTYVFCARTGRLCFISGDLKTDITFHDYGAL